MSHPRALTLLALFGLLWATTIPLIKIAVSTGHQPLGLIFWQLLIAAIALGIIVALKRIRLRLDLPALRYYLIIAVLGTILPNSFSYIATAELPAGIIAICLASIPMFSLLLALIFRTERFALRRILGVLLGASAITVLIIPDTSLPEPEKAIFILIAIIAPVCYALEGLYIAARSQTPQQEQEQNHTHNHGPIDPIAATFSASLLGAIICAPIAWWGGLWVDLTEPWQNPEWAFVASSLIHAFTYAGYIWLVGLTSAVFTSQIAYVVTIGGVAFSALFLGETYSAWVFLALILMVGGLLLVQPKNA